MITFVHYQDTKKHMKLLLKLQQSSFRGSNIHIHIYFFYLPHNYYIKYRKRRKKEVARRPNRNYRSLREVRPPRTAGYSCFTSIEEKMAKSRRWKDLLFELFSYLLNNLIFSFSLKEERDWELMTSLPSELKNLGP